MTAFFATLVLIAAVAAVADLIRTPMRPRP